MATVDQFNAASQSNLQNSQTDWANHYINSLNKGNQDPQELGRYLDYQSILPSLKNTNITHGIGSNITAAQHDFMNQYGKQIANGTNNLSQMGQYQGYLKAFGGSQAAPSDSVMKQLSVEALNGSRGAQQYLQAMHLTPQSGENLWKGFDPSGLKQGTAAYNQYMTDNPYSQTSKDHDMFIYNQYGGILKNGQQLDNNELGIYKGLLSKWNLQDMNDPYNKGIAQMQQDKQGALNAQDIATNQTLATADANNFQTMQQTKQDMNNRGIGDSGLAQDAYMRATMGANQTYQKAYADAATNKADITSKYDAGINDIQQKQLENTQSQAQQQTANAMELQKQQSTQDQFLTTQTGYMWMNGKPLTIGGKTISTMDYQKLSETQRHDIATENQTAVNDNNTYKLGVANNDTANARITADQAIAGAKLTYDYKNLDFQKGKWEQDVADTSIKLSIAQQNANSDSDKNALGALKTEVDSATKDLTAAQKAGDTSGAAKAQKRLQTALSKVDNFTSGK